jgi:tetratricopeptide (TPR) repeat protein
MSNLREKLNIAIEAHKRGDTQTAKTLYLELMPIIDNEDIYHLMAMLCYDTKSYVEAQNYARQAYNLQPRLEFLEIIVNSSVFLRDYKTALEYSKLLIEIEADNYDYLYTHAKNLYKMNEFHQAAAYYMKAIKIKPENRRLNTPLCNIFE